MRANRMKPLAWILWTATYLALALSGAGAQPWEGPPPYEEEDWISGLTLKGDLEVGWADTDIDGNQYRYWQYAIPPEDLYLASLKLNLFDADGFPRLDAGLWQWGEDVQRAYGAFYGRGELSLVRGWGHRARFYPDPQLYEEPPIGNRVDSGVDAYWRWARPYWLGFQFRHNRATEPGSGALALTGGIHSREDRYRGLFAVGLGPGELHVNYQTSDFVDGNNYWPDRDGQAWNVEYGWDWGDLLFTGYYNTLEYKQSGFSTSSIDNYGLRVLWAPASPWSVRAHYVIRNVDQPMTQNAYTTDTDTGLIEVRYRVAPGTRLRAGYERRDHTRWNTIQTVRYRPLEQIYYGEADWRPSRMWKIVGRAELRDLDDNPPTSIPGTSNTQPLLYDRDALLELKASVLPVTDLLLYGHARYRERKLDARDIDYDVRDWGLGAVWTVTPSFSVDANYQMLDWGAEASAFVNALQESWLGSLGANYQWGPLALSGSYGLYRSKDALQVDEDQWQVSLRYNINPVSSLEAGYSDDDYASSPLSDLDYQAKRFYVSYRTAF